MSSIFARLPGALALLLALTLPAESAAKPVVYVVSYPLQYFAERIGGDAIEVVFPAPPGEDPAFWMPDAASVAGLQEADLVLLNGAGYAHWLDRVTLRESRLEDTSRSFRDEYLPVEGVVTHSHGPSGEHSHAGTAFTTWLDLRLAARQARAVEEALSRLLPERADTFRDSAAALERDLLALDARLEALAARHPDLPLLASHPVYAYLARRYGLNLESVMWEPDEVPAEAAWNALEARLRERPAAWMIWEAEPAAESVERLESLGVQSLVFEPTANRPTEGDFRGAMEQNLRNLEAAFR
jgi:zinc transport system substrate-binding protein